MSILTDVLAMGGAAGATAPTPVGPLTGVKVRRAVGYRPVEYVVDGC